MLRFKTILQLICSPTHRQLLVGLLVAMLLIGASYSLVSLSPYNPGAGGSRYLRATVQQVQTLSDDSNQPLQQVRVLLHDSAQTGTTITVSRSVAYGDAAYNYLPAGSEVLLAQTTDGTYTLLGHWYIPRLTTVVMVLLLLVLIVGAWRGLTSMIGLAVGIFVLAIFIVPQILAGHDAFIVCSLGAIFITLVSVYIAHGVSKRTTIALAGSLATLLLLIALTRVASAWVGTSELITEETAGILYTPQHIDLAGLFTGGLVIASLGALYDITTGQAAAVDELHRIDRLLSSGQLFWKAMSIGREHVAALINTLALVYVGSGLPLIVAALVYNQDAAYRGVPWVVHANTEAIAEEVVRTGVASIGLLLALPLTTWLAAWLLPRWAGRYPLMDTVKSTV